MIAMISRIKTAPSKPWMKTAKSASPIGKRIGSHFQRVGAA